MFNQIVQQSQGRKEEFKMVGKGIVPIWYHVISLHRKKLHFKILEIIHSTVECQFSEVPFGFKKNQRLYWCYLCLQITMRKEHWVWPDFTVFINQEEVFKWVLHRKMWSVLNDYRVKGQQLDTSHKESLCTVRTKSGFIKCDWFPAKFGVQQSCVLSPHSCS